MVNSEFRLAYDILHDVYVKGAFSNLKINELADGVKNKDRVIRIVYGVLDRDVELEYYIDYLSKAKAKTIAKIILKIALYSLIYMDRMPDYAVVDSAVELCKDIDKRELKGYVNAVLNRYITEGSVPLPKKEHERLSVTLSKPLWLVKALIKQYGRDKAVDIMSYVGDDLEHVRPNRRRMTIGQLDKIFREEKIDFIESDVGGAYVRNTPRVRDLFNKGYITMQGKSSILAAKALDVQESDKVLDLCAAPGGKSEYISEKLVSGSVLACELHPHRVELINAYIRRMGAKHMTAIQNDATIFRPDFEGAFDRVLVDAPCSGLGVMHKKADILIGKSMADIEELAALQYAIMNNAIRYVKAGGYLVYSTCTILREENYNIIGRLLKERDDIELVPIDNIRIENKGSIQILPSDGVDGFFIAKLRKK